MSSGTTCSLPPRTAVDQIELLDAEVVLRFGLDVDFFEARDVAVARRFQDPHFRRTIVEHADEVLGLAGSCSALPIGDARRDTNRRVRCVSDASSCGLPSPATGGASGTARPTPPPSVICPDASLAIGVHQQTDVGAGGA